MAINFYNPITNREKFLAKISGYQFTKDQDPVPTNKEDYYLNEIYGMIEELYDGISGGGNVLEITMDPQTQTIEANMTFQEVLDMSEDNPYYKAVLIIDGSPIQVIECSKKRIYDSTLYFYFYDIDQYVSPTTLNSLVVRMDAYGSIEVNEKRYEVTEYEAEPVGPLS